MKIVFLLFILFQQSQSLVCQSISNRILTLTIKSTCSSSETKTLEYTTSTTSYTKTVVNIQESLKETIIFGSLDKYFMTNAMTVSFGCNVEPSNNKVVMEIQFLNVKDNFALEILSNGKVIEGCYFHTFLAKPPNKFVGSVDGIYISMLDNYRYPSTIAKLFSFSSIQSFTPYYHNYGLSYLTSVYNHYFSADSDEYFSVVNCGKMYRHFLKDRFGNVTTTCTCKDNHVFTSSEMDDYDICKNSFVVTNAQDNSFYRLLLGNITLSTILGDYYSQRIISYPNNMFSYLPINPITFFFIATSEAYDCFGYTLNVLPSTENSFLRMIEYQNTQKTESFYFLYSTKGIYSLNITTYRPEEYSFHFLLMIPNELNAKNETNKTHELYWENTSKETICLLYDVSTSLKCLVCKKGYHLYNHQCYWPDSVVKHCLEMRHLKCVVCENGYTIDQKTQQCVSPVTPLHCKKLRYDNVCEECESNYIMFNGECVEKKEGCEIFGRNVCLRCKMGYSLEYGQCESMKPTNQTKRSSQVKQSNEDHCYYVNRKCVLCEDGYWLDSTTSSCVKKESEFVNHRNEIIYCPTGSYLSKEKTCKQCSDHNTHCIECDSKKCIRCSERYRLNDDGNCTLIECNKNEFIEENGLCVDTINNCLNNSIVNDKCVECNKFYYPTKNGSCESKSVENCEEQTTKGCIRCMNGYYLTKNNQCEKCDDNCLTCIDNSTYCLSCIDKWYIAEDKTQYKSVCQSNVELTDSCKQIMITGTGCAICYSGYYKNGLDCIDCSKECLTCNNGENCLECKEEYFMNYQDKCQLKSTIKNCVSKISTTDGCTECQQGYYLFQKMCSKCNENCATCNNGDTCLSCIDSMVLKDGRCVGLSQIAECKSISKGKCDKCSFWHSPSDDGTYCTTQIEWWLIVVCIVVVLIILIALSVAVYFILKKVIKAKKIYSEITLFEMERSNIKFTDLGNGIKTNRPIVEFGDDEQIPIDIELRELFCIGNGSKEPMKIQLTMKEGNDRFIIIAEPSIVMLQPGYACEIQLFCTVHCTTTIDENFMVIAHLLKSDAEITHTIEVKAETIISTRLDPESIIQEKKIGEGSFGVVYQGIFRGHQVAIKKMKNIQDNEKALEEFEKEVAMLDKFRSDYIIHFYGAVMIPSKLSMVTEFASFGSLSNYSLDCERNSTPLKLRIKMLIDAAQGIKYLQDNGILHRDIKPDNFLVVSLDENVKVNCKLTDFGSARNVNLLMTNMTFTKGVGSPKYMAPEILNREHYKKPADIFSFAITVLEVVLQFDPYPKTQFPFAWNIADCITEGKRPPIIKEIDNDLIRKTIEGMWEQNPKDRISIDQAIGMLTEVYNELK